MRRYDALMTSRERNKLIASEYSERNALIAEQYTSGAMQQDIADHHGISKARVGQILHALGIRGADGGLARRMAEREKRKAGK